jgi:lambda family phage minor tail protein L
MPPVQSVAQQPSADSVVTLYTLDATEQVGEVFRFVSATGLLKEGTRKNWVPNPWFGGAVPGTPGTLPTTMTVANISGLTRQIIGRGVEDGLPYIDIRWFGTISTTGLVGLWFATTTTIPAVPNEPISYGAYARLMAGGWTGTFQLRRQRINADQSSSSTVSQDVAFPTDERLREQLFARSESITNPDTAYARHGLFANITATGAVDLTLRFGAPQWERNVSQLGGPLLPPQDTIATAELGQTIKFQGYEYQPFPIEAEGFAWSGRGTPPRPKLRISNIGGIVGSLLGPGGDLIGAELTRLRTFRQFLDGEPGADPNAHFEPDVWRVERKTRQDPVMVEWELASVLEQEGQRIPGRQMLRNLCTHIYRRWNGAEFDYTDATCPYTGTAYFTEAGVPTSAPHDRCGKRLGDCRLRFGVGGVLPTRAFPGIGTVR